MSSRLPRLAAFLIVVVITASGLPLTGGRYPAATAAPTLTDLQGLEELKKLFNEDNGKVRLVMLVSPT